MHNWRRLKIIEAACTAVQQAWGVKSKTHTAPQALRYAARIEVLEELLPLSGFVGPMPLGSVQYNTATELQGPLIPGNSFSTVVSTTSTAPLFNSSSAPSASASNLRESLNPLDVIGATDLQKTLGLTGEGQVIAFIDAGFSLEHPAYASRVIACKDFVDGDNLPDIDPEDGTRIEHATHVVGLAAGLSTQMRGVAPKAELVLLRAIGNEEPGGETNLQRVEKALRWIIDHPELEISVVNLSIGASPDDVDVNEYYRVLDDEIRSLVARNIAVVVAAGNDFDAASPSAMLDFPASHPLTTAVGASRMEGGLFAYSNRNQVALFAPGQSLRSSWPDLAGNQNGIEDDYGSLSGTSMAAPLVSGSFLLLNELCERNGESPLSPAQLETILRETGDTIYDSVTNASYIQINLVKAADAVLNLLNDPTPPRDVPTTGPDAPSLPPVSVSPPVIAPPVIAPPVIAPPVIAPPVIAPPVIAPPVITPPTVVSPVTDPTLVVLNSGDSTNSGGEILLTGTEGNDIISIVIDSIWIRINANDSTFKRLREATSSLQIDSLSGSDEIRITLNDSGVKALISPEEFNVVSPGLSITGGGFAQTSVVTLGENGQVTFLDSKGNDRLTASPDRATLQAGSRRLEAIGFESFTASAIQGGYDSAILNGSTSADRALATPFQTRIEGVEHKYVLIANLFDVVQVDAGAGSDEATLYGSTQRDVFTASPGQANIQGQGFRIETLDFETLDAHANSRLDVAILSDGPSNDILNLSGEIARISGGNYSTTAHGFSNNTLSASSGGYDVGYIFDTPANERLILKDHSAELHDAAHATEFLNLDMLWATSRKGGEDVVDRIFEESENGPFPFKLLGAWDDPDEGGAV